MFSLLNDITQSFFGEDTTYLYADTTTTQLKAVYSTQWVESNGVSTQSLAAEVLRSDLSRDPAKGDRLIRGEKSYRISVAQPSPDREIFTLILVE